MYKWLNAKFLDKLASEKEKQVEVTNIYPIRYPYNSLKSAIFNNSVVNEFGFNHIEFLGKFYIRLIWLKSCLKEDSYFHVSTLVSRIDDCF